MLKFLLRCKRRLSVGGAPTCSPPNCKARKKRSGAAFCGLGLDLAKRQPAHEGDILGLEILHAGN